MDIILPSDISDDCSKNDYGKERKIAAIAAIAAAATSAINGSAEFFVLKGFDETLRGTSVQEGEKVLMKYGQELNKILQERSNGLVTRVKEEGEEFVKGFLDCTEDAVQTESGLVYYSMKEGEGASPEVTNTVEVHYVSF